MKILLPREENSLYKRVFHGRSWQMVSASTSKKNIRATFGAGQDMSAPALRKVDLSMTKHDFSSKFFSREKKCRYTPGYFTEKLAKGVSEYLRKKWKGHLWRGPRYKRPRPPQSRPFDGQTRFFVKILLPREGKSLCKRVFHGKS